MRTLQSLVDSLAARGEREAVVAFEKRGRQSWSYRELSVRTLDFAQRLLQAGVQQGDSVILFAENSPEWIAAALAVIRAGAVVVPVDIQFNDDDLFHVLSDSAARAIMTTNRRLPRLQPLNFEETLKLIVLDTEPERQSNVPGSLPHVQGEDTAVLFYTSGTTGPPKGVPLSHRNIVSQLDVVATLDLINETDRMLLPLPLHHVYPFVIGMLVPLSRGLPLVMPFSLTGQQLLRALKEGEVTAIIGVPRLYSALYAGITTRLQASGRLTRRLFNGMLAVSRFLLKTAGVRAGRIFFRPLHRRFGGRLRLLASGGSDLDSELAENLQSLGWQVAIGYGLTETSPLLSMNLPGEYRHASVGKAFPGVELRIDPTTVEKEASNGKSRAGEVLARGPNVFSGYRNLPEQTARAFTGDGWFRTGDLGYFDAENFLYLSGRISTLLKTESGEKVQTEDVEAAYAREPAIREIGVLAKGGKLVALIVPERSACRDDIEGAVRAAIDTASHRLPSYERISDYAITGETLPYTRLGKIKRHGLAERFEMAKSARAGATLPGPMRLEDMSGEDRALAEEPLARAVWQLLTRRYPGKRLTPDTSLQFDLAVDSLEWLNLTFDIAGASGVEVTEEAIARIDTVRDLLREVLEAGEGAGVDPLAQPYAILDETQKRWLKERSWLMNQTARAIYATSRVLLRLLFRIRVEGAENLPRDRPWILTPNHISYLDGPVLANALRWSQLRQTYWAGWTGIVTANSFMRSLSRLGRILPVEPSRAARTSLAFGAVVLQNRRNLVWFPEGGLSPTGELQTFKPGIGMLLERFPETAALPVCIKGTRDALPRGRHVPRLRPIRIVIGEPRTAEQLLRLGAGEKSHERIANALHNEVAALAGASEPRR